MWSHGSAGVFDNGGMGFIGFYILNGIFHGDRVDLYNDMVTDS